MVKNPPANAEYAGDVGLTFELGRSPGGGNGNPVQCSCLKNSMDSGACQATVQGVTKSQTSLSTHTLNLSLIHIPNLEPVHCSMSSFNCCFLTHIQVSQEASKVVWYSHLFKNFPQFVVIHTVKEFNIVNEAKVDIFLEFSRLTIGITSQ